MRLTHGLATARYRIALSYPFYLTRANLVSRAIAHRKERAGLITNHYPRLGLFFVHVPKTAGTSVQHFLSSLNRDAQPVKQDTPNLDMSQFAAGKHATASDYIETLGMDFWRSNTSFSLVRNPWALAYSSYNWWRKYAINFPDKTWGSLNVRQMSFSEYVDSIYGSGPNGFPGPMSNWFTDSQGEDLVDFVGKVEELDEVLSCLLEEVGVSQTSGVIGRLNVSVQGSYRDAYTDRAKKAIWRRDRDVIERFGYSY